MEQRTGRRGGSGPPPSRTQLAVAREDFLTSGVLASQLVRETIGASWMRSRHEHVATDRVEPVFATEFDRAAPLARSAHPVLLELADQMANEPISILLTDANGLVLERVCGDETLRRRLDAASLSPGFSYAEKSVGTNGIGTTLESGRPTMVGGAEHYAGALSQFTCAGAPIVHPITGKCLGVLDLTSLNRHSSGLLLAFAKSAAQRIEQQLLDSAGAKELALFREYLIACQHTKGAVLALNDDVVMMNHDAQQHFDAADRVALLTRSSDAAGATGSMTLVADLPSGLVARMDYQPAHADTQLAGGVFRIQVQIGLAHTSTTPPASADLTLPGLAGTSATWQRACHAVERSKRNGEWVVLEGEPGVGKLALVHAVHQLHNPKGHFQVVDAADAQDPEDWLDTVAEGLAERDSTLLLRHADLLSSDLVTGLSSLLLEHASQRTPHAGLWVALTVSSAATNPEVDSQLLPHFACTVQVPPLRHHIEDVHRLASKLLAQIAHTENLRLAPATLRQLMRLPWAGNVEHLRRVLVQVTHNRRSGSIEIDDLPPECRTTSRRQLTQMESLERDAIVESLVGHRGSKESAAEQLGVSRATIYRKIRDYGIALNRQDRT